jgi:hypothetical protein
MTPPPWASRATMRLSSSKCSCMASVSARGMMTAAPVPRSGQMAPKM